MKVDKAALNPAILERANLGIFRSVFMGFYQYRSYERNHSNPGVVVSVLAALIGAAAALYLHHFIPLFTTVLPFTIGVCLTAPYLAISDANASWVAPIILAAIGAAGLQYHWDVDLQVLCYHFDEYLWYAFLIGAGLAVARRLLNAFIWKCFDNIVYGYYKRKGLSLAFVEQPIPDFYYAYQSLGGALSEYLNDESIKDDVQLCTTASLERVINKLKQGAVSCNNKL